MKKATVMLGICIVTLILCLTACQLPYEYTPTGEFYVKTSPSQGDSGVSDVIDLEADHKTYEGDGDITVPMIVGFGHLPRKVSNNNDDIQDTFYVKYEIIEAPWQADKTPAWEKQVDYADSWYDTKYNSSEQENHPFLLIPHYGEFYPLYKESVEIVFPKDVRKGYLQISVVSELHEYPIAVLSVFFDRTDGVLMLDP